MASKKRGLPFVVQPRLQPITEEIGSEESGILEIERKGYLTVAEKSIVQGATSGDTTLRVTYSLAGKIARELGLQQGEVARDLVASVRPEYLTPWSEEIDAAIMEMMAFQERSAVIQATALLICRIDGDWTIEDTMELHPDILAGLALLYTEEDNQVVTSLEKAKGASGSKEGKE